MAINVQMNLLGDDGKYQVLWPENLKGGDVDYVGDGSYRQIPLNLYDLKVSKCIGMSLSIADLSTSSGVKITDNFFVFPFFFGCSDDYQTTNKTSIDIVGNIVYKETSSYTENTMVFCYPAQLVITFNIVNGYFEQQSNILLMLFGFTSKLNNQDLQSIFNQNGKSYNMQLMYY